LENPAYVLKKLERLIMHKGFEKKKKKKKIKI